MCRQLPLTHNSSKQDSVSGFLSGQLPYFNRVFSMSNSSLQLIPLLFSAIFTVRYSSSELGNYKPSPATAAGSCTVVFFCLFHLEVVYLTNASVNIHLFLLIPFSDKFETVCLPLFIHFPTTLVLLVVF